MLKGAKAMTEVRKPGGHGEVASVLSVFQFKPQTVRHQRFTEITFCYPPNLILVWAKHAGSYIKVSWGVTVNQNFDFFFFRQLI